MIMNADNLENREADTTDPEIGPSNQDSISRIIFNRTCAKMTNNGANCLKTGTNQGNASSILPTKLIERNPSIEERLLMKAMIMVQNKHRAVVKPTLRSFPIWSS